MVTALSLLTLLLWKTNYYRKQMRALHIINQTFLSFSKIPLLFHSLNTANEGVLQAEVSNVLHILKEISHVPTKVIKQFL